MNPELPLRDIHLPGDVSWWPPALGWWLLLILLILVVLSVLLLRHLKQRQRLRKLALAELQQIENHFAEHQDSTRLAAELSILLRRICISRFPRQDAAGLTGEAWLNFLDRSLEAPAFTQGAGRALISAPYQKQNEIEASTLIGLCRDWINQLSRQRQSRSGQ